jgi:tRNA threonylcarbamoyladenosine biosynthesis protein TsaE
MGSWKVVSRSARQTINFGHRLGKLAQGGEIVGLIGDLGTGKTCFVRGVARGAGVGEEAWVRSPTFTLINEYQGRLPVYHIDLYRVGNRTEIEGLNLREYLYSDGISLVEWFEHLPAHEASEYLEVKITHAGTTHREISLIAHGGRYERLLAELRKPMFKSSRVQKFKD